MYLLKRICLTTFILCLTLFHSAYAQIISIPHLESTNVFFGTNNSPYIGAYSDTALKLRFTPSYICYFDAGLYAKVNDLIKFFNPVQENPAYKGEFNFLGAYYEY